jgi:hypothetical protein
MIKLGCFAVFGKLMTLKKGVRQAKEADNPGTG